MFFNIKHPFDIFVENFSFNFTHVITSYVITVKIILSISTLRCYGESTLLRYYGEITPLVATGKSTPLVTMVKQFKRPWINDILIDNFVSRSHGNN